MQGYNISNSFNFKQSSIIRPTSTTLTMPKFLPVALDLLNLTGWFIAGDWEEFIIIIMNKGQKVKWIFDSLRFSQPTELLWHLWRGKFESLVFTCHGSLDGAIANTNSVRLSVCLAHRWSTPKRFEISKPYNRAISLVFRPNFVVVSLGIHPERVISPVCNVNLTNNLQ